MPKSKKTRVLASDSEDDEIFVKKKKTPDVKTKPKPLAKPEPAKLKPTSALNFFGSSAPTRKEEKKPQQKRKTIDDDPNEIHSDDDFEKTLDQLDEQRQATKKPRIETPDKNEKRTPSNENSPPNKLQGSGSLASKLSAKIKNASESKGHKISPSKDDRERKHSSEKEEKYSPDKERKHSDKDKHSHKQIKDHKKSPSKDGRESKHSDEKEKKYSPDKERKHSDKDKHSPNKERKDSDSKEKLKKFIKEEKKTPKIETDVSPLKDKKKSTVKVEGVSDIKVEKKTPTKNVMDESMEVDGTPDPSLEKKKVASAAYKKYLSRTGPNNPGSKEIPEGAPDCLNGLVFVLTGVGESLDREQMGELIKKYGGKVTTSLSKNTSFLVIGDEAGESKLKKAESLGTKTLDEDAVLELIRTRKGKKTVGTPSSKDQGTPTKKIATPTSRETANSPVTKSLSPEKSRETSSDIKMSPVSSKFSSQSSSKFGSPKSNVSTPSPQRSFAKTINSSQESSPDSSQSTQPLSSQEISDRPAETSMWVDKYKPASVKNIIGQQGPKSNVGKLTSWLENWHKNHSGDKKLNRPSPWAKDDNGAYFKAALLSGPPGVGKTTSAHLVCRTAGFDFVEFNASDARSKKTLDGAISELLSSTSLSGFAQGKTIGGTSKKHALVMDEVDGMSGNEDRGGVQELITLIKKSKVPIICMCNDRNHPKIRSLANHTFDLRFFKPRIEQIRGPMLSICFREGIKIKPDALDQIIMGANQDVRQVLHHLSMWSANQKNLSLESMSEEAKKAKKDFKLGPWDVAKKVFSESEHKNMSIHDKSGLFFHDYSIAPLFVQENYPKVVPHSAGGNRRKTLEQIAKTALSLADGDLIEKTLRSSQAWSLLPTQAMFSSVIPGEYMSGHLSGQIEFPKWLGNNSKRGKFDRLSQEIQLHTRLKCSGSKTDIIQDYCYALRNSVTRPLISRGADGVADAVAAMNEYDLLREDLESILEVAQWPGHKDPMAGVESKVKAAFTRLYNKESHMSPYAAVAAPKKKVGAAKADEYGEDDEIEEDEEEDDSIGNDAMIKVKKPNEKKAGATRGGGSSGKGRGGASGRGKGKK